MALTTMDWLRRIAGKHQTSKDVTVVLTSCGRHDLLDRTLASFRLMNTYAGVKEIIVVEDGADDPSAVCSKHGARLIRCGARIGQARAVDLAYAEVTTPLIFHCEDDWEFYKPGFIEKSKAILAADPSTMIVWLRAWDDTNNHPLSFEASDDSFGAIALDFLDTWHGFSFNPGLRRLADYKALGGFTHLDPNGEIGVAEREASMRYRAMGYRAVILDRTGYVRHTGGERHVD